MSTSVNLQAVPAPMPVPAGAANEPFSLEQKQYLEGFFAGVAQRAPFAGHTASGQITADAGSGLPNLAAEFHGTPVEDLCREELWKYERTPDEIASFGPPISQPRGMAFYGNSLIVSTIDNHVQALDAKTGKLLWDTPVDAAGTARRASATPIVVHGKVIQGVLCILLHITIIGWIPATIWALIVTRENQPA